MTHAHCDFETRSDADLRAVGLHNYARHPSTDVWCMAWAIGDMEPQIWLPTQPLPRALAEHVANGGRVVAHNAPFELEIWNVICVPRYGFPTLRPEQCECTMATGYAMGLPGALEDAALALGLHMLKDADGRAVMLRMSRPRRVEPDGTLVWWDEADKRERLYEYCRQDVRVERALHERLVPLGATERRVWLADYRINQRGVQLDVATARGAEKVIAAVKADADRELTAITGGAVQTVGALAALKQWCTANGVAVTSLDKESLPDVIAAAPDGPVKRALTIRGEVGKASVAKIDVMLEVAGADGRLRNLYQYHGANTGRWAGRKVQPHNLTRDVPDAAEVEQVMAWLREGNAAAIDLVYGPPMTVLSRVLRPMFVARPGHVLVGGDWSNVEGRGVAWFSGEQWKIDAFIAADEGRGPGIYELTAASIAGVPVEQVTKEMRQKQGKVPELAFGYQGGLGAFRKMGKNIKATDGEIEAWKVAWRTKHARVKATWYALQEAAINAVRFPGEKFNAGFPGRHVTFKVVGSFLWCLLPSKRALCYPYPKILDGEYGPMLTYMTQPGPDDRKKGRIIHDPNNSATWARVSTYGGSLMENVVQAFCRDMLADLILWADERGDEVAIHTHDDCYAEIPEARAEAARAAWQIKMNTPPAWAAGFPLNATVEVTKRYGC